MDRCSRPRSNNMFGLEKHLREQHRLSLCKVTIPQRHRHALVSVDDQPKIRDYIR